MTNKNSTVEPANDTSLENPSASNLELWDGSASVVNQGRHWSSSLIWIGSALFGSSLIWAFTAQLDQTVTVQGRLVPAGRVREVESPSAGRISEVFVTITNPNMRACMCNSYTSVRIGLQHHRQQFFRLIRKLRRKKPRRVALLFQRLLLYTLQSGIGFIVRSG